jgi:hypothetical protein
MISCTAIIIFFLRVHLLAGQQHQSSSNVSGGTMPSSSKLNFELQSLLTCFLAQPNLLLLSMLIDKPLGQSGNGFIREQLHLIDAPSSEALQIHQRC